jgi:hypothetical protein
MIGSQAGNSGKKPARSGSDEEGVPPHPPPLLSFTLGVPSPPCSRASGGHPPPPPVPAGRATGVPTKTAHPPSHAVGSMRTAGYSHAEKGPDPDKGGGGGTPHPLFPLSWGYPPPLVAERVGGRGPIKLCKSQREIK